MDLPEGPTVALLVARSDGKEAAMQAGADTIDELLQRLFG
jgi:hypothetical protein